MFECEAHGQCAMTDKGECQECCIDEQRCEECGIEEGTPHAAKVYFRDTIEKMLCDDCVECEDCGTSALSSVEPHSDFDAILCEECADEREEDWQRDEEDRKERNLDYASKRENETDPLTQHEDGWR